MKIQSYKSPIVPVISRMISVKKQRKTNSYNSSNWITISIREKRQKSLNVEKHSRQNQQSNISSISNGRMQYPNTPDTEKLFTIPSSKNDNVESKTFLSWNDISYKNRKISPGIVNDMKRQPKKKNKKWQQFTKWFCKPLRICCMMLACLILAAIPIGIIFGLQSKETKKSLTCQTLLTFENLANQTSITIVNGYGGLNWLDIGTLVSINRVDGYRRAMVSPSCVTFSPAAKPGAITPTIPSTTFSLVSFYAAAPWLNGTQLFITGSRAGTQIYSANVMLFTVNVTFIELYWENVDYVKFTGWSSVLNNNSYYSMDNMCLG